MKIRPFKTEDIETIVEIWFNGSTNFSKGISNDMEKKRRSNIKGKAIDSQFLRKTLFPLAILGGYNEVVRILEDQFALGEDYYNEDEELAIPIVTCSGKGV